VSQLRQSIAQSLLGNVPALLEIFTPRDLLVSQCTNSHVRLMHGISLTLTERNVAGRAVEAVATARKVDCMVVIDAPRFLARPAHVLTAAKTLLVRLFVLTEITNCLLYCDLFFHGVVSN